MGTDMSRLQNRFEHAMKGFAFVVTALLVCLSSASADQLGDYYVTASVLNERTAPISGQVINRIYRGQKLTVYEVRNGWGLVTTPGFVERWVSMEHLARERPPEPQEESSLAIKNDPRIEPNAIPRVSVIKSNGSVEPVL